MQDYPALQSTGSMRIVIIGNGIAGTTASRYIRKYANHELIMISGEAQYPYARTALMYTYMGQVRLQDTKLFSDDFWPNNNIQLIHDWVTQVDSDAKTIYLETHSPISYDHLILATGATPRLISWPGQSLAGVQTLYGWQDVEAMEQWYATTQHAVIVGGGLIGIELAEMLHSRQIPVTILVRESHYWGNVLPKQEAALIEKHLHDHGVNLELETTLVAIEGDGAGRVKQVVTSHGTTLPCEWVGVSIGVVPNCTLAKSIGIECGTGILVDEYLHTSIPAIYAIGDCVELRKPMAGRNAIETTWYTGKMMGKTIARTLAHAPTSYRPGIWYNSAKFFDLTYQAYGQVSPKPVPNNTLFWQDAKQMRSVRFEFTNDNEPILTGITLLGIHVRHNTADKMIREKWPLEKVAQYLPALFFIPELAPSPVKPLQQAIQQRFPHMTITTVRKRVWKQLIFPKAYTND